jgi:hypothetical protein
MESLELNLKKQLESRNIKVIDFYPKNELHDAILYITDNIHIQIGHDYTFVVVKKRGRFYFYESSLDIEQIISDLHKAVLTLSS